MLEVNVITPDQEQPETRAEALISIWQRYLTLWLSADVRTPHKSSILDLGETDIENADRLVA